MSRFLRSFGLLVPFLALLLLLLPACESDSDTETDTDGDHEIEDGDNDDVDGDAEEDDYVSTACPEEPLDGLLAYVGGRDPWPEAFSLHVAEDRSYHFVFEAYYLEGVESDPDFPSTTLITLGGIMDQTLLDTLMADIEAAYAEAPSTCVRIFGREDGCDYTGNTTPFRARQGSSEYYFFSTSCPYYDNLYPEWVITLRDAISVIKQQLLDFAHAEARAQATQLGEGDPCPQADSLCAEGLRCDSRNRVCKAVE